MSHGNSTVATGSREQENLGGATLPTNQWRTGGFGMNPEEEKEAAVKEIVPQILKILNANQWALDSPTGREYVAQLLATYAINLAEVAIKITVDKTS
jgi:hypothetical protein